MWSNEDVSCAAPLARVKTQQYSRSNYETSGEIAFVTQSKHNNLSYLSTHATEERLYMQKERF